MSSKKILWTLFPTYIIITLFSIIAFSILAFNFIKDFYIEKKTAELEERAYLIEDQIKTSLLEYPKSTLDSICQDLGRKGSMRITIILGDGKVIGDSDKESVKMDNHATRPEILTAYEGQVGSSLRYSNTVEKELLYVAVPLLQGNRIIGVLRTSIALDFIQETIYSFQREIIYAGLIITIFAAIFSLFVANRIANPLEEMKQGVERFASGELSFRLKIPKSRELSKLAESLNAMAAQLDEKIKRIIEQKNEQQAVLESMVEGVFAVDMAGKIINLNQTACKIFKAKADDVIGKKVNDIIDNTDLQTLISKTFKQNLPVEKEIVIDNKRYLQGNGTVLKNATGQTVGALVVLNDVTKLRRLENVRRDFVANVSHEIRTPLTSIKGFAETLLDGAIEDSRAARNFVEIIAKQSNRLNAIIEDLLTLARLEQEGDRADIDFSDFSLAKVLESAIHVCRPMAKEKNIDINLTCDPNIKIKINPDLFEQAIVNLIENAIKYSSRNKNVNITVDMVEDSVDIVVADQGAGIEKKHLKRLFERFYRVDKARSRSIGGTGLGLSIVKHITQVHNGTVSVKSKPGKGSKFKIHLPLEKSA